MFFELQQVPNMKEKEAGKERKPSRLQRNILVVLASLDKTKPGPVPSTDLERILRSGSGEPVYRPNLQGSCRRLESAGYVRMLRSRQSLRLAVELTDLGRTIATPLLEEEVRAEQLKLRQKTVVVLPVSRNAEGRVIEPLEVKIEAVEYQVLQADFVIRLNGSTCLQLWHADSTVTRLEGDPLKVADWYKVCYDSGVEVRVQVNETPDVD